MTNQLKNEKSPYLKQHENNPVDWFAWNKETLQKAKNDNVIVKRVRKIVYLILVPILLQRGVHVSRSKEK